MNKLKLIQKINVGLFFVFCVGWVASCLVMIWLNLELGCKLTFSFIVLGFASYIADGIITKKINH
jgi:hypothetical protein